MCVLDIAVFYLFAHSFQFYFHVSIYPWNYPSLSIYSSHYQAVYLFVYLDVHLFRSSTIHPFTKVTSQVSIDPSTQLHILLPRNRLFSDIILSSNHHLAV